MRKLRIELWLYVAQWALSRALRLAIKRHAIDQVAALTRSIDQLP